jgi:peptide deformylase
MSTKIYPILQYPDDRLQRKGHKVLTFNEDFQAIIERMFTTHYAQNSCAALAATQLDMPDPPHVTVIDFSDKKNEPLCLVNANIIKKEGEATEKEGCMSVGGKVYKAVSRAAIIHVEAQDQHGKPISMKAEGFMARCIQHELDHLNGTLFIDYLKPMQRRLIDEKLYKLKRKGKV